MVVVEVEDVLLDGEGGGEDVSGEEGDGLVVVLVLTLGDVVVENVLAGEVDCFW